MNYVYLSPYFPPNYYHFCVALKRAGANVLGLGDMHYDSLRNELKEAFTEYYRVSDMHNYDELHRAMGYFIHKYGRIDGIDSNNEYWLETEARLRTDFNIEGIRTDKLDMIKNKSDMKKVYQKAGVAVARGKVVKSHEEAMKLIEETGFPIVAKPDSGVGAANTYKIHSQEELNDFFESKPAVSYILEEFIDGQIVSFDGLTDKDGNLLFFTSHIYERGVMEVVNKDLHIYYHSVRDVPKDLEKAGKEILKAFEVKGRFFHFEFFRRFDNKKLVALEVNMRPPGGFTTDMFNFACDIDLYQVWANMVVNGTDHFDYDRKYYICYVGRKHNKNYLISHEQVLDEYGDLIVYHDHLADALSRALGNYGYLLRSESMDAIFEAQRAIHQMKGIA
jgi:biotin carboxylase